VAVEAAHHPRWQSILQNNEQHKKNNSDFVFTSQIEWCYTTEN